MIERKTNCLCTPNESTMKNEIEIYEATLHIDDSGTKFALKVANMFGNVNEL